LDSETNSEGAARRRGASWVLLALAVVVVAWRALEAPVPVSRAADDVAHAAAPAGVDRLAALERQRPAASPRLDAHDDERDDALPAAVTRPALSARYERSVDGATGHAFWLHRGEKRVSWERPDAGARWDFAQHPLDPRRVQAQLSLDAQRVILELSVADLRDEGLARAWADASLGGFTARELAALRPTGAVREAFGLRFEQLRPAGDALALRELWWHAELQLALEWRRRTSTGEERQVLREWSRPARADALQAPGARHPDWPQVDAIDFFEALSER